MQNSEWVKGKGRLFV